MSGRGFGGLTMLQFGIIATVLAIPSFFDGHYVGGLFCLFAGLYFISARKVPLDMKITWSNIATPVPDGDDFTLFDQVVRVAAYMALAGAIAVWAANVLSA